MSPASRISQVEPYLFLRYPMNHALGRLSLSDRPFHHKSIAPYTLAY